MPTIDPFAVFRMPNGGKVVAEIRISNLKDVEMPSHPVQGMWSKILILRDPLHG